MPFHYDFERKLWNLPQCLTDAVGDAIVALLGVSCDLGSRIEGTVKAAEWIRRASNAFVWSSELSEVFDVSSSSSHLFPRRAVDLGDMIFETHSIEEALAALSERVSRLPRTVVPLVFGGNHCITLPLVQAALARHGSDLAVVHIDHHLDLQLWGEFGTAGPVVLDKIFHTNVMSHVHLTSDGVSLIQLGIDPFQQLPPGTALARQLYLKNCGVQVPYYDICDQINEKLITWIGGRPVYLSVDVDVLPEADISITGYPSKVGVPLNQVIRLLRFIVKNFNIVGADVVEFGAPNPAGVKTLAAESLRVNHILLTIASTLTAKADRTS